MAVRLARALEDVNSMRPLSVDGHDDVVDDGDDGDDVDQMIANDDDLVSSVVDSNDLALAILISYFHRMYPLHFHAFFLTL